MSQRQRLQTDRSLESAAMESICDSSVSETESRMTDPRRVLLGKVSVTAVSQRHRVQTDRSSESAAMKSVSNSSVSETESRLTDPQRVLLGKVSVTAVSQRQSQD